MKKKTIGDVECKDYGMMYHSSGMNVLVFQRSIGLDTIKALEGVFLNPILEADSESIFALQGTEVQFERFYYNVVREEAIKAASKVFDFQNGLDYSKFKEREETFIENFKPWYSK